MIWSSLLLVVVGIAFDNGYEREHLLLHNLLRVNKRTMSEVEITCHFILRLAFVSVETQCSTKSTWVWECVYKSVDRKNPMSGKTWTFSLKCDMHIRFCMIILSITLLFPDEIRNRLKNWAVWQQGSFQLSDPPLPTPFLCYCPTFTELSEGGISKLFTMGRLYFHTALRLLKIVLTFSWLLSTIQHLISFETRACGLIYTF